MGSHMNPYTYFTVTMVNCRYARGITVGDSGVHERNHHSHCVCINMRLNGAIRIIMGNTSGCMKAFLIPTCHNENFH